MRKGKGKKTVSQSNRFLKNKEDKKKFIIDAVYSSCKIEGSKITKKKLEKYYEENENET